MADASPTKRFFISYLVRDLSLEDAILDLVDNAVDSLVRTRNLDVSAKLLHIPVAPPSESVRAADVRISITKGGFRISDTCGGIGTERAQKYAFRFGNPDPSFPSALGVFGIGMKRALFKLGNRIAVTSRTVSDGFRTEIDASTWVDDPVWEFQLTTLEPAQGQGTAGTDIEVRELSTEVLLRLDDPRFLVRLADSIAVTYALFLGRFLTVELNGHLISPKAVPLGGSPDISPVFRSMSLDGVSCDVMASLAAREDGEWNADRAGWYVVCNGRLIVTADKTKLTGWGLPGPAFVSKYRGFVGVAFFFSSDPALLPWTTTKRDLNVESEIYQVARKEMASIARPVLTFLNRMYPGEPAEATAERRLAESLKPVDVAQVVSVGQSNLQLVAPRSSRPKRSSVSIQYKAEKHEIDRVRKKIDKPTWSAGAVGRFTFEHYLRTECPE
ncbi:MAG: ATP-binding protein [Chloroflexi bacterium]|nr:ATP-binding protein [Chloroflexota bacterium]